jgi:hypothetical protein
MIAMDTLDELGEMLHSEHDPKDDEAIRALRKIWLESVMVESFEDVADLIQSAIS